MQSDIASYRVEGGVAVLKIDSPPVNALSHAVRIALAEGTRHAIGDPDAIAMVLICGGRTFFAGADVKELGRPILPPLLSDVMASFEAADKPIVAAMHGTALGGGFELALAAHYRVAVPSAAVGLPEVALGLLPGAGGTQRVPRLVGVERAVELIGLGRKVGAAEAAELGLIDAVVREDALETDAIAFARDLVRVDAPLNRVRDRSTDLDAEAAARVFDRFRLANPERFVGLKAPEGVLQAIEAAVTLPFEAGIAREREIARALTASPESAAQRHLFFAERTAAKFPGAEQERAPTVDRIVVSGDWKDGGALRAAGVEMDTTGGGIVVIDDDLALDSYGQRLAAADGDVLIATRHLGALDRLAASIDRPERLVGLGTSGGVAEIVVTEKTRPSAALAASAIVRRLGCPAIFVAPADGLVVERLHRAIRASVEALRAEGVDPGDIATTGRVFGWSAALLPDGEGEASSALEARLLRPVMIEALEIVSEGVASRGSDVDFAAVRAGLWPVWRGGPVFAAEKAGVELPSRQATAAAR